MNNYGTICKEVLNVFNKIPKKQLELIPNNIIEDLKFNSGKSNEEVQIKFDKLGNPILSKEAKAMIVMLYQKYFLDDKVRGILLNKLLENDMEKQKKLKK